MTEDKKKKEKIEEAVVLEETKNKSDLAIHEGGMEMIPMSKVKKWYDEFVKFSKDILKENLDYGKIPGTPKPTLLKPGAEKLRFVYGLGVEMKCMSKTEKMDDPAFIDYTYKATVTSKSGQILAESEGSCNSYEAKFKYTWFEGPKPNDEQIKRLKAEKKGRWKKNAKGAWIWQEKAENPEVAGLKNTIMKMAQKRAMVAAILIATGASEFFTQDLEDMDIGSDNSGPSDTSKTAKKSSDITQDKAATQPAVKPEDKKPAQPVAKTEEKKPDPATGKAPEKKAEEKTKIEDPINEVLGSNDATLVIREREVLREWKEVVDKYTNHKALGKEAEEIVGGCMITGKIDTDKAQYLRMYINKKFKWLRAQAK
jgi:hypothetical protein